MLLLLLLDPSAAVQHQLHFVVGCQLQLIIISLGYMQSHWSMPIRASVDFQLKAENNSGAPDPPLLRIRPCSLFLKTLNTGPHCAALLERVSVTASSEFDLLSKDAAFTDQGWHKAGALCASTTTCAFPCSNTFESARKWKSNSETNSCDANVQQDSGKPASQAKPPCMTSLHWRRQGKARMAVPSPWRTLTPLG